MRLKQIAAASAIALASLASHAAISPSLTAESSGSFAAQSGTAIVAISLMGQGAFNILEGALLNANFGNFGNTLKFSNVSLGGVALNDAFPGSSFSGQVFTLLGDIQNHSQSTIDFKFDYSGATPYFSKYATSVTYEALANQGSVVPEPETYAMLLAGLGAVGFMSRRRKAAKAI